jgi:ribosomal protein L21E
MQRSLKTRKFIQILNHKKDLKNNKTSKKFKVGDFIRIRKDKTTFERAYDKKYGGVMKIVEIKNKSCKRRNRNKSKC